MFGSVRELHQISKTGPFGQESKFVLFLGRDMLNVCLMLSFEW